MNHKLTVVIIEDFSTDCPFSVCTAGETFGDGFCFAQSAHIRFCATALSGAPGGGAADHFKGISSHFSKASRKAQVLCGVFGAAFYRFT